MRVFVGVGVCWFCCTCNDQMSSQGRSDKLKLGEYLDSKVFLLIFLNKKKEGKKNSFLSITDV